MKKVFTIVLLFGLSPVMYLFAYPGGATGYTKKSGTAGCGCHGGSYFNTSVLVNIAGPDTIAPNAVVTYTATVSGGPSTKAGIDIAASSGTLSPISSYLKSSSNELTHTTSVNYSGGKVVFSFTYKAPNTAGTQTLYATGSSKKYWNWSVNKVITVLNPTAVEFTLFTAAYLHNNILLEWKTATETNNRGFTIEKKSGSSWESIDFVQGNGTTTSVSRYSYVYTPLYEEAGTMLTFRLKQSDFDGSFMYSEQVRIQANSNNEQAKLLSVFPNPARQKFAVKFSLPGKTGYSLRVYSVTGKEVAVLSEGVLNAGEHSIETNTEQIRLPQGVYFVVFTAGGIKNVLKLVILK